MAFKRKFPRNRVSQSKRLFASKLRRNMTLTERMVWHRLRDKQLGVRIYTQYVLYGYIADFWHAGTRTVIEIDGSVHLKRKAKDAFRDAVLKRNGIRTMRFTTDEVKKNLNAVVSLIKEAVTKVKP